MKPALQTRYVFTIAAFVGSPTSAGDIGTGVRRIIPVTGGEVKGRDVNGRVLAGGADFQIIRPNQLIELEAKYAFETDDGAVVYADGDAPAVDVLDLADLADAHGLAQALACSYHQAT